jgi:5-methylcytosine-specific restriction endonuclease McrA
VSFVVKEVSAEFPKMMMVRLSEIAKADTMSVTDHIYGVRVANGKRTDPENPLADHILCVQCGQKAYKRVRVWEEAVKQRPVYHCQVCGSVFELLSANK